MAALTLYRRHTKSCIKGYPQNFRVHYPGTKEARTKDCKCPIAAEGTLEIEGYITNRSTKETDWSFAQDVAKEWEEWKATTPPIGAATENPTVEYAVQSYMASQGPQGKNLDTGTFNSFRVLLEVRLMSFCATNRYKLLREFDNLDVVTKFTESWVNLQPSRNRRTDATSEAVPLEDSTKKAEVERLRAFFAYCVARKWLDSNQAKEIKFKAKTEKKFGMEPEEEERVFKHIDNFDKGGYNSRELRAFCLVMRHAGLRISDATALNHTELVPRASGSGWALKLFQKKTDEWVYIPIPNFVEEELRALNFKGELDGRRYWFQTCLAEGDTAKNNWYTKIMKPVKAALKEAAAMKVPFRHAVTPHTFRHTFAISHLNAGTDIKFVSRWLGHASTSVTEKHYAHATLGTRLASEDAYDASLKKQQEVVAQRARRAITIVPTKNTKAR